MCFWCVCVCVCWGEFSKYVPWRITIVTSILTRFSKRAFTTVCEGVSAPAAAVIVGSMGQVGPGARTGNQWKGREQMCEALWPMCHTGWLWHDLAPGADTSRLHNTRSTRSTANACVCVCVCCSIRVHAVHDNSGKQGAVVNYVTC